MQSVYIHWLRSEIKRKLHRQRKQLPTLVTEKRPPSLYLFILVLAQTSTKSPSSWHVQLLYLFWCWPRPVQKARQSGMYNCFVSFGAGSDQHKKPVSLACTAAFFLYFGAGSDQYKTPISLACTAACTAGLYSFRSCTPFVNPL